ncbi:MAG TPA: hypothetical protein VFO54_11810 [Chryseosolibacter sp.]|nr:hypothetical protein [Chryseosolibacter sp.]
MDNGPVQIPDFDTRTSICVGLYLFAIGRECVFDIVGTPQAYHEGLNKDQGEIPGNFLNDGRTAFIDFV